MLSEIAFLSYSREDSEFALRLARELKAAGARVWMDQLDIEPGARWVLSVEEAMSGAARMLVVLSPASVASANVANEYLFALEESKRVIPVLYRDCKVPFQLRPFQYADFRTDFVAGLASLLRVMGGARAEAAQSAILTPGAEPIPSVVQWQVDTARPSEESGSSIDAKLEVTVAQTPRDPSVHWIENTPAAPRLLNAEGPQSVIAQAASPSPGAVRPEPAKDNLNMGGPRQLIPETKNGMTPSQTWEKSRIRRVMLIVSAAVVLVIAIVILSQMPKSGSQGTGYDVVHVNNSAFHALKADVCQFDAHLQAYRGTMVTADNFPNKSPAIQRGRPIGLFDVRGGTASPVAVVSDLLLRQSCASNRNILGTSLLIDGEPHMVVGVFSKGAVQDLQGNEVDLWFTAPIK